MRARGERGMDARLSQPSAGEPELPLDLLSCWKCGGDLKKAANADSFICTTCGTATVERDGILYAEMTEKSELQALTIDTFGKRWTTVYDKMGPLREFFLETIEPVQRDFFKGKIVVDGGGGFGRLTKLMLDYGAKHAILLDASDAVYAAREYLADFRDRVTLVRGNLLSPPLRPGAFDIFLCHGVMHHVGDPRQVMLNIGKALKPDTGTAIVWVYGLEGNGFLRRAIYLSRRICSLIGDWGRWRVASVLDAAFWALTRLVYTPLSWLGLKSKLWYSEYFMDFLYRADRSNRIDRLQMYHDFLTTQIADFYSREQLEAWCREVGFRKSILTFFRKQSWSVVASFDPNESFTGRPHSPVR